jgi:hypothetical protein
MDMFSSYVIFILKTDFFLLFILDCQLRPKFAFLLQKSLSLYKQKSVKNREKISFKFFYSNSSFSLIYFRFDDS